MITCDTSLHSAAQSGTKKAWAWGVSQDAHIQLTRAPYTFQGIIDGNSEQLETGRMVSGIPVFGHAKLSSLCVEDIILVVFADLKVFGEQILKQIAGYGAFQVTAPVDYWLQQDIDVMLSSLKNLFPLGKAASHPSKLANNRILLALPNLFKGGADRQMVLLAIALAKLDYEVLFYTYGNDAEGTNEWQMWLQEAGVNRVSSPQIRQLEYSSLIVNGERLDKYFPPRFASMLVSLIDVQKMFSPFLSIGFLDNMNVLLGLSTLFTQCGELILSARSQAPAEVPGFVTMAPFQVMKELYLHILQSQRATMVCNSPTGRTSYLRWLDATEIELGCIENAVYLEPTELSPIRSELSIGATDLLVCGVMRLIESKRPMDFVEAVHKAHLKNSDIFAVIVGDGPLFSEVSALIESLNAQGYIKMAGLQESALPYLAVSDAFLHTSCVEGTANVLLEAQAMGVPVFAYESDETRHAVNKTELFLCEDGNTTAMSELISDKLVYRRDKKGADGTDFEDALRMAKDYLAQTKRNIKARPTNE
ncbi:glycosyltransferase [Bowmanella denitrificans]|uniref:glycosyltransferase n=1 Tax=Bowmanella denitrificans TaxID=366582 RepID=UPI000C99DA50|nr:glycosyltransferase [Bowmanella denitrificans]